MICNMGNYPIFKRGSFALQAPQGTSNILENFWHLQLQFFENDSTQEEKPLDHIWYIRTKNEN